MKIKFLIPAVLFFLAGCIKNNDQTQRISLSKADRKRLGLDRAGQLRSEIQLAELKLVDVPTPFNVEPVAVQSDDTDANKILLTYELPPQEQEQIIAFYEQEMERFGWQKIAEFNGQEVLRIYTKPRRYCTVSLRPQNNKKSSGTQLVITSGARTF